MRSAWLVLLCACGGQTLLRAVDEPAGDQPTPIPVVVDAGIPPSVPDASVVLDAGSDAGTTRDAGLVFVDAGAPDAGPVVDAGAPALEDAGAEPAPADGGTIDRGPGRLPRDAGESTVDAGEPAVDAGPATPEVDSGVPTPDAGLGNIPDAGWTHTGPWGTDFSVHLPLGMPDGTSVGRLDAWLLVRPQLVGSYDTRNKVPNWSAWLLDSTSLGSATRATTFRTDPLLPTGTPQAKDSDYTSSGFDRGHLCPSADRTATDADNDATFFLTNVVPQTHASNAGPWLDLEDFERTLAGQGKHLWIIAGPIFGATRQTIGTGVAVPLSMFKVIVVSEGPVTPGAITPQTVTYAAVIPNVSPLSGSWRQWQVSVDDVEALTGLDFLSDVDPAAQASVERTRLP
ncbi:MAG: DNA/RNA non-specific endonuclease [Myxococcaceae bacterium]